MRPLAPDDPVPALRRQLAAAITRALGPQAQFCIAPYYDIPQARMSELGRGLVHRCSMEWLIHRVHGMGGTVTLDVSLGDVRRAWHTRHFRR